MHSSPNRNSLILQQRRRGVSRRDVAREFGLSVSRIGAIEKEAASAKSSSARCARVREKLHRADDLDKAWPVTELVEALGLPVIFRVRLLSYFEEGSKEQLSLRELFNLVVSSTSDVTREVSNVTLPVWGIGKIGLCSVLFAMARLNMGRHCNVEWRSHFARFAPSWLREEMTLKSRRYLVD